MAAVPRRSATTSRRSPPSLLLLPLQAALLLGAAAAAERATNDVTEAFVMKPDGHMVRSHGGRSRKSQAQMEPVDATAGPPTAPKAIAVEEKTTKQKDEAKEKLSSDEDSLKSEAGAPEAAAEEPAALEGAAPADEAPKEPAAVEEETPSKEPDARKEATLSKEALTEPAAPEEAAEVPPEEAAAPEEAVPSEEAAPAKLLEAAAPSPPAAPRVMRQEEREEPEVLLDLQAPLGGTEAELRQAYANLLSLLVSSAFILAALVYALWENWYWPAFLFAAQSLLCAACHFCDPGHGSPSGPRLLGYGWECPATLAAGLRGADLCLSYLLPLQLGLMLLGPEDPVLQHAEGHSEAHLRSQRVREARVPQAVARGPSSVHGLPLDVLLLSRLGAPALVAAFVETRAPSEGGSTWECAAFSLAVAVLCSVAFWSLRHRCAAGVLLRLGFWRRLTWYLLLPLSGALLTLSAAAASGLDGLLLDGLWRVATAALAILAMWKVRSGDSVSFTYDDLRSNPVVAHHALWLTSALGLAALVLQVVCLGAVPGAGAVLQTAGPYLERFQAVVAVLMVASAGAMWCVLDLVSAFCDEEQQRRRRDTGKARTGLAVLSWSLGNSTRDAQAQRYAPEVSKATPSLTRLRLRKPAALLGYAAVSLGALALAAGVLGRAGSLVRACGLYVAGAALAAEALAAVLLTCSVYGYEPSETTTSRWRTVVTAAFTAAAFVWAALLRQALRSGVGAAAHTAAPVALALLHLAWPLTWLAEAPVALNFWVQWYRVQAA